MVFGFRELGLVSMIIFVAAAGLPLLGEQIDWQNSVSYTWARTRRRFVIVGLVMSVAVTLICASFWFWLVPHYRLPFFTYPLIVAAYTASIGVLWVPMHERPGEHSIRHLHFLGGAILATLAAIFLATVVWGGANVPSTLRFVCVIAMLLAALWPLLFITPARQRFLVGESLIALSSSVAIMFLLIG
jgi:hypothetical protein